MIEQLRKQYFNAIILLNDKKDVIEALPQPEYESFFEIIEGIIMMIEKNIKELNDELKNTSKDEFEMIEYLQEELEILNLKKELCEKKQKEAIEQKELDKKADKIPLKNIIYATTEHGNVYIEKDLKAMPEEYYDDVKESIQQIREGFDVDSKNLVNNNKLAGLREKNPFKVRVFYRILSNDTAYVMLARMKKGNNDLLDRTEAIVRKKKTETEFNRIKEEIKNLARKEELIAENDLITEKLFTFIKEHRRG